MKLISTLGSLLFSGIIAAAPLNQIIVFGDSLSDNGNLYEFMKHQLPPSPPYFRGHFSNGPVWVEYLAAYYFPKDTHLHHLNYAFGGAGVSDVDEETMFTLKKELDTYLMTHDDKADPNSLYIVWIGANNYLAIPENLDETVSNVNTGIINGVELLVKKGAKHILLLNLPDLSVTPAALEFNAVESFKYFTKQHNEVLNQTFNNFKEKYPDVRWLMFDINYSFKEVYTHPEEYGFADVLGTCISNTPYKGLKPSVLKIAAQAKASMLDNSCKGYLFFDLVHPTAWAHRVLADKAIKMLDESGVEFSSE